MSSRALGSRPSKGPWALSRRCKARRLDAVASVFALARFDREEALIFAFEEGRRPVVLTEDEVREHALAFGDALVAGDVDRAIQDLSDELRRNVGEVLALLPLPAREATVESIDHSGSGYNVVLRLVGETSEDQVQTRWKDRDGEPRIVEASHLSRTAMAEPVDLGAEPAGAATEGEGSAS